ncbi:unnamed protein product [Adineta steineri]|uniref:Rab-GAP TBC domain-containing protein n=1 Tax=Adineta steineri TaxID=433720 RepID=A0A815KC10_9BILA|nr:unnamed protein product [Adineta steineri]CAF1393669.1 unnamed protein product [Adineta steineri]
MHIELEQKQYHHGHRQIWTNIRDLLKSCFGFRSKNNRLFNKDGSLIDVNHLRTNISNHQQSYKQRQQTWPYLLNIYSPSMTNYDKKIYQNQAQIRYNKLKRVWQERISRGDQFYLVLADKILRDVHRTDRHVKFIKKKKEILFNIMMTYSVYHPYPCYSQGMSDMLTPIVYVFVDESLSYFAYCSLMTRYMNLLFDQDQIEINHRLYLFNLLFHSIDNELWKKIYFNQEEEEKNLFVYRWLLLDCKREFYRFDDILRVLELIWINSISSSIITNHNRSLFTIFICISILQEDRMKILSYSNEEDLNKYFYSSLSSKSRHHSTKRILERAQKYYLNYTSSKK